MPVDSRTNWQIVADYVKSNGGRASIKELEAHFRAIGRPPVNARPEAVCLSVNANSRVHYPGGRQPHRSDSGNRYDLLYQDSPSSFELYDPEKHGIWEVYQRQDETRAVQLVHEPEYRPPLEDVGEAVRQVTEDDRAALTSSNQFRLESHLRDYLAQNLMLIRGLGTTLKLYEQAGQILGVEYQTDVGRIDILAIGANKAFYILELKLSKGPDAAVGQTLRYMAAVRTKLAEGNPVFGVIVASEITDRLRYAVSEVRDRIFLLQYELQVSLHPVDAAL